ncbi:Mrr restriction system protein [subsurface metagenome]
MRDKLFELDPHAFEKLVGKVLNTLGAHQIRVTGTTADGGIDGEAEIPILEVKLAFQAKKWAEGNTVGIDPVQRFIGSIVSGRYDRGIFVTTSGFTQGAKEVAERPDSRIVLIDGEKLVDIMIRNNLGICTVPIIKQELDSVFFQSLIS